MKAELMHYSQPQSTAVVLQVPEMHGNRCSNLFGEVAEAPSCFWVGSVCVCGFGLCSRGCVAAMHSATAMELRARPSVAACFLDHAQP